MKYTLAQKLLSAIESLQETVAAPWTTADAVPIERTRQAQHGDYASNAALVLAKASNMPARELALKLQQHLPCDDILAEVTVAGPGFINFHLTPEARCATIPQILDQASQFGASNQGGGRAINLEFVSTNPTGPLHVGHGRGAAFGASLANLLRYTGYNVHCEYYVNDAGRQMDILATSVWLRYLTLFGHTLTFPEKAYQGDYITDIATLLKDQHGKQFVHDTLQLPTTDVDAQGDAAIDAQIRQCQEVLGAEAYRTVFDLALSHIMDGIRDDLCAFGVTFDTWFSERSLVDNGAIEQTLARLTQAQCTYTQADALWFKASNFGDEKDRVLQRSDGRHTYFCSDIAYHLNKLERGAEQLIDIWGSDHHGYVPRLKGALVALGVSDETLTVPLVQFATLYRQGQRVQMSTRSGSFVTLRELIDEVGRDAARFLYLMRRTDQHLEFDLDLAKAEQSENPVYYVQYAHARIASVLEQGRQQGISLDKTATEALIRLDAPHEQALIRHLTDYPDMLAQAATHLEPHRVAHYLRTLADQFHSYYAAHKFIIEDRELCSARLSLIQATQQVLANGLSLLGVSAPSSM